MREPLPTERIETVTELRARAVRMRRLARDFPGDMGQSVKELADELEESARKLEAGQKSDGADGEEQPES